MLAATGSKELRAYGVLAPERVFVRVLPTHEALNACEELGIPHRNILAMQGPFSEELNCAKNICITANQVAQASVQ